MCGLFGAVGPKIDGAIVEEIARLAGRRGCHAWGMATADRSGVYGFRRSGVIDPDYAARVWPRARVLLGHARLATSGVHYRDPENAQPMMRGRTAVAHNGVVPTDALRGMRLASENDSEALLYYAEWEGAPTAVAAIGTLPGALLILQDNGVYAYRQSLPLFVRRDDRATYFCSVTFDGAVPFDGNRLYRETITWDSNS